MSRSKTIFAASVRVHRCLRVTGLLPNLYNFSFGRFFRLERAFNTIIKTPALALNEAVWKEGKACVLLPKATTTAAAVATAYEEN